MRYALYFAPTHDDPLTLAAESWLGRSAFTGAAVDMPVPAGFTLETLRAATQEPRRYGFHATLVAPFRLGNGISETDLQAGVLDFVRETTPFVIPGLALKRIGRFFALTPTQEDQVADLAASAVDHFLPYRAPLNEAEIARRKPEHLSERQRRYLEQYGYPFVKDEFRFHLTLTGPLHAEAATDLAPVLHDRFDAFLHRPVTVSAVTLFVEDVPGSDFIVHSSYRFGATEARKYA